MYGVEHYPLAAALAAADPASPAGELADPVFAGMTKRCGDHAGPTDWVAVDADVVEDHLADPLNNFAALMTVRFLQSSLHRRSRGWHPGRSEQPAS